MRFFSFSDLMPCCGSRRQTVTDEPPQAEEELLRDPPVPRRSLQRRRVSFVSTASKSPPSAAADWRPSLRAITEDSVVPEKKVVRKDVRSQEKKKNKLRKSGSRARFNARPTHYDDFGRSPVPAISAVFSPTPFLF